MMGERDDQLVMVAVDECDYLEGNPQRLDKNVKAALRHSILRDGFVSPILVRPHGERFEVVAGNHRVEIAVDLGIDEVPALVADLDDDEVRRLAVGLNSIHGEPDPEMLADFLPMHLADQVYLDKELMRELARVDDEWSRLVDDGHEVELEKVDVELVGPLGHIMVTVPLDGLADAEAQIGSLEIPNAQVRATGFVP